MLSLVAGAATASPGRARADATTILNPGRVCIGDVGALEGGALIARANDGAATWYNPAGLARASHPSISSNASVYELNRIETSGGGTETANTFNIVPSYMGSVGFIVDEPGRSRTAWGFAIVVPLHWKSIAVAEQAAGSPAAGLTYSRYSSAAEVRTLVPGVAVAQDLGAWVDGLSVGVGLSAPLTTEYQQWTLFERQDPVRLLRQASFVQESMAVQAQFSVGVAWRPIEGLDLGLQARLPAIDVYGRTSMHFGHVAYDAPTSDAEHGSEKSLGYAFKRPTELGLGAAWTRPRFGLEVDATLRLGLDAYHRFGGQLGTRNVLYETENENTTREDFSHAFDRWSERTVFNVRGGGHVRFTQALAWHVGAFTDRTPLERSLYDDYGGYYQKVDLFGATTGVTYENKNSVVGLGVSYTFSGDMKTEAYDLESRENVRENASVDIIGFILSGRHSF
jgi:hypothetical protein